MLLSGKHRLSIEKLVKKSFEEMINAEKQLFCVFPAKIAKLAGNLSKTNIFENSIFLSLSCL